MEISLGNNNSVFLHIMISSEFYQVRYAFNVLCANKRNKIKQMKSISHKSEENA